MQERTALESQLTAIGRIEQDLDDQVTMIDLGEAEKDKSVVAEAEEALAKATCRLAVLLRGTPVQQIVSVAEAGESMPAKSTFFHPKLPSGLVIHPLKV